MLWDPENNKKARFQSYDPFLFALDLSNRYNLSVVLFLHGKTLTDRGSKLCMVDASGEIQDRSPDQ